MVFEDLTQIETQFTRLLDQFLIYIQHEIVFVVHLCLHPGGCEGKFSVIGLVIKLSVGYLNMGGIHKS